MRFRTYLTARNDLLVWECKVSSVLTNKTTTFPEPHSVRMGLTSKVRQTAHQVPDLNENV